MSENNWTPDYVQCTAYQATVEEVESDFEGKFRIDFQYRREGDAALFRIITRVRDDNLTVFQTHIARFGEHPLSDEPDEDEITRFLDDTVVPAVFPFIQEGVASGATRVRPGQPLFIGLEAKPLTLKHD
ncbi:hypothetical protein HFP15_10565 [Amycolatopsis sp. K13G38]|uniref:Uncharacterized protein n=1 Tax=Amycolatopsis acididurans TaxID=2724524 RepID=A0ABX1J104_9PSEU|nr:hypothetical protein [Amycolatopsis acididurans]NKQ53324.1 hypothetical protein [Amycolatopsis acididurans]